MNTKTAQATCVVPWCRGDHQPGAVHVSPITAVATLAPGLPGIAVMLIATPGQPPTLHIGDLPITLAQAPAMAALMSQLGHYELAAAITRTAERADGAA